MFLAMENDTSHKPKELKAIVWNSVTKTIVAYCKTAEKAKAWADRLNGKEYRPVAEDLPDLFQGLMA